MNRNFLPIPVKALTALVAAATLFALPSRARAEPAAAFVFTCPTLTIIGRIEPPLDDVETRLVCGDEQGGAWRAIPFDQARFSLKGFLQDRGYLHPVYYSQGGRRFVNVGSPTRVSALEAEGAPDALDLGRKRKVLGEALTPKLLGTVEQWATKQLLSLGYPCPKVRAEANEENGRVLLHVQTGPLQDLTSVFEERIPGAEPGVLRRYDAFRLGKRFDGDLLTVSENRVTDDNLVQSAHFTPSCGPQGATAREEVTAGPPRLLTVGFGSNTEGVLLGKVSWRNARLGRMASYVDLTTLASVRKQRFDAYMNWYFLPFTSRRYGRPLVQFLHDNEQYYEYLTTRAQYSGVTTWDYGPLGAIASLGPTLDLYRTYRGTGSGTPDSRFLSLEGELKVTSHDYELNLSDPRNGYRGDLIVDANSSAIYSTASAQRLMFAGEGLWNVRGYDPSLLILGLRTGWATTITGELPGPSSRLPPTYFRFLGGSTDLRGFGRQELPTSGLGGLTSVFADLEARLVTVLPFALEPFVFLDFGAIGGLPWSLDPPIYWSPGVGLRLRSPIGVLRTTLAHGYPSDVPGHYQFYLSFGEEF